LLARLAPFLRKEAAEKEAAEKEAAEKKAARRWQLRTPWQG
jgi:hypothetical protein